MSGSIWRTLDTSFGFDSGSEQVARAAAVLIVQNLEAQCELQETVWASRDQDWASAMGFPYVPTRITRVPRSAIYLGAQPSLVVGENSRFDKWPAITVRCGPRTPASDLEQPDQSDVSDLQLIVEVLAVAGPFEQDPVDDRATSDAVDRQYQRLGDAVVGCVNQSRSLQGNVLPIKAPPRATPSLPFVKKTDAGAGKFGVYQGVELVWVVTWIGSVADF